MNLPQGDIPKSFKSYIHGSVQVLQQFEWVYRFKMTEILFDKTIEKIPEAFIKYFHSLENEDFSQFQILIQESHKELPTSWPEAVRGFIYDCRKLKEGEICETGLDFTPSGSLPRKWSRKKFEEVSYLSNYVREICGLKGCDAIVDIGSGLGYLSSHLAQSSGIPVIAVESNSEMVQSALESKSGIEFVNLELTSDISTQLFPHLSKYSRICVTGLHACGNLTPWSIKLFLDDPRYSFLAIVPCCYHKMNQDSYQNIPLSRTLMQELTNTGHDLDEYDLVRNEAFCRIASQRSGNKFAIDLENETRHVFYRSLLEFYAERANIEILKNRRKGVKGTLSTFQEYIIKTIGPDGKFSLGGDFGVHEKALLELFDQKSQLMKIVTGIVVMQGALQSIAENLILLDRVQYLVENENIDASLKRIIPIDVSPRGMILSAKKWP